MDIQSANIQNNVNLKYLQIIPHRLFSSVQQTYLHPLHFTHVVHHQDNYIYLCDQLSMEILGKSKVQVLTNMKLFAFSNDFNLFYGLKQGQFIMAFELQKDGSISHRKLTLSLSSNLMNINYLRAHTFLCIDQCNKLVCVNQKVMCFIDAVSGQISYIPDLKYEMKHIQTEHSIRVGSLHWVIGCANYLYSVLFNQKYESYQIINRVQVGQIKTLNSDNKRNSSNYVYVINIKNEVTIVNIEQQTKNLNIIKKISFFDSQCLYVNFFQFSINTSTTNKFKYRLYLIFYCKKQLNFKAPANKSEMQQENLEVFIEKQQTIQGYEKFQQIVPNQYFNYIMIQQTSHIDQKQIIYFNQTRYIMRNMPQIKISPWLNDFSQNGYFYLCTTGEIVMIDFTQIKQFEVKAEQWVNLGFRFQALRKNQIYQQKTGEFEQQQNENEEQVQLTQDIMNDWSESGLPQYLIMKNKVQRIRCFQF